MDAVTAAEMPKRIRLPPRPPDDLLHATKEYDPRFDSPAGEGVQQLIVAQLWLTTPHRKPEREAPPPFTGKVLLIKCQSLENGANGQRRVAIRFLHPIRGRGAEDGSQILSDLDKFFERVLGRIPRPGTFELGDLIGLNFMAKVIRKGTKIGDEYHPRAFFHIVNPDAFPVYDQWPRYPPVYDEYNRHLVFKPPDLGTFKI